ncbi:MAG TPA: hypothetical protein PKD58_05810 [Candidatus Sumerlaeota bacterium]|nr:hypothetical protein [Candidatus Sumerlaeota bacterium]HMX62563.1 hypothetical protein [Candidatus Sumerlaeota bacterium]
MRRLQLLLVLCVISLFAVACKQRLEFITGAPIQTPYRVNDGVIASFPDEIKERLYKIKVGGTFDGKVYQVPVQEAYASELTARLSTMFTRGVSVINQSIYDQITPLNAPLPASRDESQERNLDEVLADLRKKESGEKDAPKKTEAELTEEAFRAMDVNSVQSKNHAYLLKFDVALLGMVEGRVRTSFVVHLIDRRTGNELMKNQYQGRSERFVPKQSERTNELELQRLVRQSLSGGMSQMMDDLAIATGATGSKR